ncbi:roadblock/LC7 domain-containing protein [Deinococcus sp.]|uniref:roadblock/LC7 domain-containing protein n=1 Tax=Deinococcus sp. TaxID=47478 RepID=UPI0025C48B03|nr:roadblock/LC7 domain-containing protein [Deinococcus sp.]
MRLEALKSVPGLVAGVLVGEDGLPLETVGEGGEALAAELASLRGTVSRISTRMGAGRVTRLSFTSERMEVVAIASGDYVLGAAVMRGHDTRAAQQALARLALEMVDMPAGES